MVVNSKIIKEIGKVLIPKVSTFHKKNIAVKVEANNMISEYIFSSPFTIIHCRPIT